MLLVLIPHLRSLAVRSLLDARSLCAAHFGDGFKEKLCWFGYKRTRRELSERGVKREKRQERRARDE